MTVNLINYAKIDKSSTTLVYYINLLIKNKLYHKIQCHHYHTLSILSYAFVIVLGVMFES